MKILVIYYQTEILAYILYINSSKKFGNSSLINDISHVTVLESLHLVSLESQTMGVGLKWNLAKCIGIVKQCSLLLFGGYDVSWMTDFDYHYHWHSAWGWHWGSLQTGLQLPSAWGTLASIWLIAWASSRFDNRDMIMCGKDT